VVRDRASLARIVDDGEIENVYRLQIMNATERRSATASRSRACRASPGGARRRCDLAGPAEARWVTAGVRVPPETAQQRGPGAHPSISRSNACAEMPTDGPMVRRA
jgi:polyferredoxin